MVRNGRDVGALVIQHRLQPRKALLDNRDDVFVTKPGEREIDGVGTVNDCLKRLAPDLHEGLATARADLVDLSLWVVALALDAQRLDQALGGEPLDRAVDGANCKVCPLVNVLFFSEQPEGVPVHRTTLVERAKDEQANG